MNGEFRENPNAPREVRNDSSRESQASTDESPQAASEDARASLRPHLDGLMSQYDAISEADRRWGEAQRRGIALCLAQVCMVGIQDDRHRQREIRGTGPTYEAAFREAESKGFGADGIFSGTPAKNPLIRDL
jgi:hypothetical protein